MHQSELVRTVLSDLLQLVDGSFVPIDRSFPNYIAFRRRTAYVFPVTMPESIEIEKN
jgi:hypothetical protein